MRDIQYLINDVREQTDNRDTNGVKDREIIRYFNDGVKTIQAIIYKNNPLCNYCQASVIFSAVNNLREYTLPTDVYGDNAVSMVELESSTGSWHPIERVWPEDGANFFGWFIRGKKLVISGQEDRSLSQRIRVWYFKRLPRFEKLLSQISSVNPLLLQLSSNVNDFLDLMKSDGKFTIVGIDGVIRQSNRKGVLQDPITLSVDALTPVDVALAPALTSYLVWGGNSTHILDLPEEVEPYLMDYVAKRVYGRNNYATESSKIDQFTEEERSNIIAIFSDASQALVRAPITDTEYLRI